MTGEEWRDVVGFEGLYEVSNKGRVRSLDRMTTRGLRRGVLRRLNPDHDGYLLVTLSPGGGCKKQTLKVNRIVCQVWHGDPPSEEHHAAHRDAVKSNNTPDNLYWATPTQNSRDLVAHGNHVNARKTHCKRKHPFTPDNTAYIDGGRRQCRTCIRERKKEN